MKGEPFIVKSYDIAQHNNPHLVALANGIRADDRFGNADETAAMMDALQTRLAEVLYKKAPHLESTRFHRELMTRVHYAIDFIMKQAAESK